MEEYQKVRIKDFHLFLIKKKLLQINNINCFWKSAMISQFHFKEIKKKLINHVMPGSIEKEKEKKNNSISKLDIRWFHFKKKKKMMMIIKLLEIDNLPNKQHKYNPIKKKKKE